MTNRELMKADRRQLSSLEKQRQNILLLHSLPSECPNPRCREEVTVFDALNVDVDDYTGDEGNDYHCHACEAPLRYVVPIMAMGKGWYWAFDDARVYSEVWNMT